MENCSSNDQTVCLLCYTVTTSEAELDAHIGEQHSDFFTVNFQTIRKYEDNKINNENTLSFDTKSRQLDLKRRVLSVRRSQLAVKSSQVPVKSILFDLKNGQLDLKKSLFDLKCTKCDIQEADKKSTETVNDEKAFKCKKCVNMEPQKSAKMEANIDQTNQDRVVCQICKKDLKNKYVLNAHHNNVHTTKDKVLCQECAKILPSEASLNSHMKHVHGEKMYQCHPCKIFFGQKINLEKHTISFHCLNNTKICFQCQKDLTLNVFPKKSRKMIDGQFVSICSYCTKRNKLNVPS